MEEIFPRMTPSRKEMLDDLWILLIEELTKRIRSGEATSADLATALRFIKEGDIEALKDTYGNADFMKELMDVDFDFEQPNQAN